MHKTFAKDNHNYLYLFIKLSWIYQDDFAPNSLLYVLFGARRAYFEKSLHRNILQLNVDRLKGLMKRTIIIKCRKRDRG